MSVGNNLDRLSEDTLRQASEKESTSARTAKDEEVGLSADEETDPFEITFDENDPMDPKNKSQLRKWLIVAIVTSTSFLVTNASSIYTFTYDQMDEEFGNSRIVATLGLTTYVVGLAIGPVFVAPLSEFYGRRPIYIIGLVFYVIWLIPCAVAQNIQTTLIARFFSGCAGAAFLSVAGGTVGDMFLPEFLLEPMLFYSTGPQLGPCSGPLIGGFVNYYLNWRWTYYILMILSAIILLLVVFFVPETYAPVLLRQKAQKKRKETGDDRWKAPIELSDKTVFKEVSQSLYRPLELLVLEPMLLILCLFCAVLLGILYLFFGAFNIVFTELYDFNLWQVGLSFLGLGIGMLIVLATDHLWQRHYLRLLRKQGEKSGEPEADPVSEPELRLPSAIVGSWFCVIGLFWFAWTTFRSIHWIVPIIGTAFFGGGVLLVFTGIFTFLVEAYPLYAASALAANSFARSSFAASFPLFGDQMYHKLGINWATTLLACLTLILAPFTSIFYYYGKRIRAKSKFGGGAKSD